MSAAPIFGFSADDDADQPGGQSAELFGRAEDLSRRFTDPAARRRLALAIVDRRIGKIVKRHRLRRLVIDALIGRADPVRVLAAIAALDQYRRGNWP